MLSLRPLTRPDSLASESGIRKNPSQTESDGKLGGEGERLAQNAALCLQNAEEALRCDLPISQ